MPENGTTDIKVQLAGLKQEIENINSIHNRLDTAIDKLTDVSTSIKSMLAVHEEKLDQYNIKFLMHPGPVNEGVEISNGLQNSKKSIRSLLYASQV